MENKLMKLFVVLILIVTLTIYSAPLAYAALAGNARGESGPAPVPPTPTDSKPTPEPSTPEPSTPEPTGPTIIQIPHYTSISGYVYESTGQTIGTSGKDSSSKQVPVAGVRVDLSNGQYTYTNSNGYYEFSNLSSGTYTTEFIYGTINGISQNNVQLIKNALRYNGHDYITLESPGNTPIS